MGIKRPYCKARGGVIQGYRTKIGLMIVCVSCVGTFIHVTGCRPDY